MASDMKDVAVAAPVAEYVTLSIPPEIKERIAKFRRHPRETWGDILTYIMDRAEAKP